MKEYPSDRIYNLAIVSHSGTGKTSLTEALLFKTGATTRQGKVEDGTTTTDFEPEEIKRKVTISTSLASLEWKDNKINLLDTPGYADFVGEVKGALRAADTALLVVCAASGVQVNTEKAWEFAKEQGLARAFFINRMDRENANYQRVIQELRDTFGTKVIPMQLPMGSEANFKGVIDVISQKAFDVNGEIPIPDDMLEEVKTARSMIMEAVAEEDDNLLTKYLEEQELSTEEMVTAFRAGVVTGHVYPVFCGSAYKSLGMIPLLFSILEYLPSAQHRDILCSAVKDQEDLIYDVSSPFSAFVFKTTADPFVGRLSYIRAFSGKIMPDTTLYNSSKNTSERIGNIFTLRGKTQDNMPALVAGDIGVVAKLQETTTGDTLCDKENAILYPRVEAPIPLYTMALQPKNKGDEDKIGNALSRLIDEDLTLKTEKNSETHQTLIYGCGELHLDIMAERMKRKFGVEITLSQPKVPYRETLRGSAKVEGKHKKQSGGHGQYGHVWLQLDPLSSGSGFEFVDSIFGGSVPRQYIPAVEKGVKETLAQGVLAGYPMVDVKVTLLDGSYHTVDSSEMAFKVASSLAIKKGALQAKPILLEPIANIEVHVPEYNMGDIIGDLNSRRGRIQGMEPIGNGQGIVKAQLPQAEVFNYSMHLRSLTQGRGSFTAEFSHYEEVPQRIADAIISNISKDKDEEK